MIFAFVGQLFRGSGGGSWSGASESRRSRGEAVDEAGNVYQWSGWQGKWVPKSGALGFGQEVRPVQQGIFGPVAKRGGLGSDQHTQEGRKLYEPRQ